ncbi:MAG TPA: chloride channel protein [Blastocatellia bacterium]|nr:chloride channel protein [Blastocatellia bacterium]
MSQRKDTVGLWYRAQVRARRTFDRLPHTEQQKIFILTLLIGALGGLAAVVFHVLLDFLQNNIIYRIAAVPSWWRIPGVIVVPAIGGLITGAGLYFWAPEARGSGIPQVKAAFYLDGGRIPFRAFWGKMFFSSFNIGTGASLGREGPTVQICASLASLLGRLFALSRQSLTTLVPVGAATGLAAAFNTPIAAVTFTLEEILGDSAARPMGSIVIAAVIAAVVEHSILGEHPLFQVPPYRLNNALELVFYALLGVLAGFAGVTFNQSLLRLRKFFLTQRLIPQWAAPGAGGLLLGGIGLIALLTTGSPSIFGVGYGQLSVVLQSTLPLKVLMILGVCKLAGTVMSYSSGSSGGIFGPALYIGGMLGAIVGLLTHSIPGGFASQPGAFALVGMGAVFAGIVRAPITSIVMIFEMTANYSMILPLMIANIISYAVATKLDPIPIYDALLDQDGVRLPHNELQVLRTMTVGSVMSRNIDSLGEQMTVNDAFHYMQGLSRRYHSYPVLSDDGRLRGLLTFNDLKRALAVGQEDARLKEVANKNLVVTVPDSGLDSALVLLTKAKVSQLLVVSPKDPGLLMGIMTMHDVARTLNGISNEPDKPAPDN